MRITKENLTRYDQHFKSWHRRRLGCANALENWHQTEEAGAVAFYPVGGSMLEGKVKFSFKETPPASGDKAPDNPSTITGVESVKVTRCAKNLVPPISLRTQTINDVVFTVNQDGSVLANGTASADAFLVYFRASDNKDVYLHGNSFIISGCPAGGSTSTYFIQADIRAVNGNSVIASPKDTGSGATYTNTSGRRITYFAIKIISGYTASNLLFKPQLEFGTTSTEYETPANSLYTIALGNTYYGGEIDLATGLMTVTHVMSEIDGSVIDGALTSLTNTFPIVVHIPESILPPRTGYIIPTGCTCDKLPLANNTNDVEHIMLGQYYAYRQFRLYLSYSRCGIAYGASQEERIAAAKTWLNNNPVKLVLNLREDYRHTVQLDPVTLTALAQTSRHEPRLNTVYTDADSIQITYQKSPIRAATEQEMAILGLGGNV